jgi:hypothetical protein
LESSNRRLHPLYNPLFITSFSCLPLLLVNLAYTWPSPKDEYDLDKMKPYRQAEGWRREPIVSFAVFPGLKLTLNNGWMSKDYDAVGALVRLWVRPHISDFEPRAPIP